MYTALCPLDVVVVKTQSDPDARSNSYVYLQNGCGEFLLDDPKYNDFESGECVINLLTLLSSTCIEVNSHFCQFVGISIIWFLRRSYAL